MPLPDVYFLPGYAQVYEVIGEGRAIAFHLRDGDREGLEVMMVRPVDGLPFLHGKQTGWKDASSVYGYGGPLFNEPAVGDTGFQAEFFAALAHWCRVERVVCRFVRFHALIENHRPASAHMEAKARQPTVHIDLTEHEDLLRSFRSSARRHVRRAMDAGLRFRPMEGEAGLDAFRELYTGTMTRVDAAPGYSFPRRYFLALKDGLGDGLCVYGVFLEDRLAAAGIFMTEGTLGHYHLGASDQDLLSLRPNNFLFYRTARALRDRGCRLLHLGGGVSGRDSLFQFKKSLSPHERTFYTAEIVIDPVAYRDLVGRWEDWPGRSSSPGGYFPAYRTPGDSDDTAAQTPQGTASRDV